MSKWHRSDRTPSAYNKVVAWPIVETALLGSVQSARTKLYCSSRTPLRELVFADSSVNNPIGIHTFRTWTQFSSVKFICCEQGLRHRTKQLNRKLIQGIHITDFCRERILCTTTTSNSIAPLANTLNIFDCLLYIAAATSILPIPPAILFFMQNFYILFMISWCHLIFIF